MKSICFFGIYDKGYSRSKILKRAFEENEYEVIECHVDPKTHRGWRKYIALKDEWEKIPNKDFDHLIVCFPGHSVVWLARLLYKKPIVFDAFVSLFDSNVWDRKKYSPWHPKALYDLLLDYVSCRIAGTVILDTHEHIKYFHKEFKVPLSKCVRVLVGADEAIFYPRETKLENSPFVVHFHGSFIPLQGIEYIIEAARILKEENIVFNIIGKGQEYTKIRDLSNMYKLENITFIDPVPTTELPSYIERAHVCLGIFGHNPKTARVIPNKVYEYAAMGKPIISSSSSAIREVFTPNKDIVLCEVADGTEIAKRIMYLRDNEEIRNSLAKESSYTFASKLKAKVLGRELIEHLPIKNS